MKICRIPSRRSSSSSSESTSDWSDSFDHLYSEREEEMAVQQYTNWTSRHEIYAMQELIPLSELYKWLIVTHRVPFTVKARRDEARDAFQNLISNSRIIFGRTSRIPNTLIVNVSTGVIADLLDRILLSLDYGERFMSDLASTSVSKLGSIDDAKLSFSRAVQRLLDILTKTNPGNLVVY